jgi:hypothetical protein
MTNKIKNQICISVAKRNSGTRELLEDYANLLNLSQSDTFCKIIREYDALKTQDNRRVFR